VKCEEYTVHVKNDKYCENSKCPSNVKAHYMQKAANAKGAQRSGAAAANRSIGHANSKVGQGAKKYVAK
jgi:hypothetical protein